MKTKCLLLLLVATTLSSSSSSSGRRLSRTTNSPDSVITVGKHGQARFTSIKDALNSITAREGRITIHIHEGIYQENITIERPNITLIGDGTNKTILCSNRSDASHHDIQNSAALNIEGDAFIAVNVTFENVSPVENGRAVALRSTSDKSAFYRCKFISHQDTLYIQNGKQFFRECEIAGTTDFIFGDATAVFQNCLIEARKPKQGHSNVITAQGRETPNENTGISIQHCTLTVSENFSAQSFLGRPWKRYSRTVIMQSYIGQFINPEGWLQWNGTEYLDTLTYREYSNFGPGADTSRRVNWPGFKVMGEEEANKYTVKNILGSLDWLTRTGIPFSPSLNSTDNRFHQL